MRFHKIVALIGIVGISIGILYTHTALSYVMYGTLYEKLGHTDIIAVGTITGKKVQKEETYNYFRAKRVIYGQLPVWFITIKTWGGQRRVVAHAASYQVGETYLVFLTKKGGHYCTEFYTSSTSPQFHIALEAVEPLLDLENEQNQTKRTEKLLNMLRSENGRVIESAIIELQRLWRQGAEQPYLRKHVQSAVPDLIHLLQTGPDQIQSNALRALREIGGSKAIAPIRALVDNTSLGIKDRGVRSLIRSEAARSLGYLKAYEAEDSLRNLLRNQDEHIDVRRSAADALGELNSTKALPYLEAVLKEAKKDPLRAFQEDIQRIINRIIASKKSSQK